MNYAAYYNSHGGTWHVIQQDHTSPYWYNYATVDSEDKAVHLAQLLQEQEAEIQKKE